MCVSIFSTTFVSKHFSFHEKGNEMWSKMYVGPHVQYPLFLSDFKDTWILSADFRKNAQLSNFMKIRPVGAQLFHVDGRTDMYVVLAFRNFANASRNQVHPVSYVISFLMFIFKICSHNFMFMVPCIADLY